MESVPLETNEVTHSTDRKIRHEIHPMGMNGIYGIPPVLKCTPMRIKNTEVERRVTYSGPGIEIKIGTKDVKATDYQLAKSCSGMGFQT